MQQIYIRHTFDDGVFGMRVAGVMIRNNRVLLSRLENDDVWALPGGRTSAVAANEAGYHGTNESLFPY